MIITIIIGIILFIIAIMNRAAMTDALILSISVPLIMGTIYLAGNTTSELINSIINKFKINNNNNKK